MRDPLRIGAIGLGRHWRRRFRPALQAMPDRFAVRAVYDAIRVRAEREARSLGCEALPGMTPLLEREDIDALLLADRQWFGLWPAELAGRLRKPVYCAGHLIRDDLLPPEGGPLMMAELLPRFAPATARLHDLLRTSLGPAKLVVCEAVGPERGRKPRPFFDGPAGVALLDWCLGFLAGEPTGVQVAAAGGIEGLFLELPEGRAVHIVHRRARHARPGLRLHVAAADGSATIRSTRRVAWTGPDGHHVHTLPQGPSLTGAALEKFARAVRDGRPSEPGLNDVRRCLALFAAARQSQAEGRRVSLDRTV